MKENPDSVPHPEHTPPALPANYVHNQEKKGRSWGHAIDRIGNIGSAMGKIFSLLFYVFLISAFLGAGGLFGGSQGNEMHVLYGSGEDKVAVIDLNGVILDSMDGSGGLTQTAAVTPRQMIETFEILKEQENLKGVVLRINSPGGSVTASEEIYQIIKKYKTQLNVPVIVSMADTAASGGYYVALAADSIVAAETTLTGSIGAIIQTFNFQELANRYGVQNITIASGPNKDMLNPFEPVEPEEQALLQSVVNEAYAQFLTRVTENRQIDPQILPSVTDGRVMSGLQAKQANLIDEVGTLDTAINIAKQKANVSDAQVVVFGQKSFLESLLGATATKFNIGVQVQIPGLEVHNALKGTPAYLYMP